MSWQEGLNKKEKPPRNLHNLNVCFSGKNVGLRKWVIAQAEEHGVPESQIVRAILWEAKEKDSTCSGPLGEQC